MDNQNLNNQIDQDKKYFSDEKNPQGKRFKIIIVGVLSLLILISLIFAGYTYLKNQKLISPTGKKLPPEIKQEIKLFERFPNSSNKGNIAIDQNFIWVANGAGLIRYNKDTGEQKIFTESDGLLGNETREVVKYEDEIWVASQSRGISILDTKNNSWRYFTTANGLVNDGNLIIKLDGDVLWLATFDGFAKYDFATGKWTNWKEGAGIKFAGVSDFVFDDKKVWINVSQNAYTRGGIIELDKSTLIWRDLIKNNTVIAQNEYWAHYKLNLLDQVLYIPSSKNLYTFNTISGEWKIWDENLSKQNIPITKIIKHNDNYWYFTQDNNIAVSNELDTKPTIIKTDLLNQYCPTIKHGFNFSGTEDGYEKQFNFDGDILWFGCRQSFAFYNLSYKTWNFKETRLNYPAEIYNILAVKNGTLLVDSNLGFGLVIPDKQKWTFIKSLEASDSLWGSAVWSGDDIYFIEILEAFGMGSPSQPPRLWKYNVLSKSTSQIKTPDDLSLSEIIDLKINNNLWFNSGNEIQEFNPVSGEVFSYKPTIEQGKYLTIKDVKKNNNVLWFVSNLGLGSFNLISKEFEIVGNPTGIKFPGWGLEHLSIVGNKIWTDASDNPGDGLYIYDLTTKTWEHLTQTNSGLKFDWVRKLTGTTDYLLMTSFGKDVSVITVAHTYIYEQYGLNIYDVVNNTWKFFTSEDGMLDGEIESMHVDEDNVWFSNTENGIWKLNIEKLK